MLQRRRGCWLLLRRRRTQLLLQVLRIKRLGLLNYLWYAASRLRMLQLRLMQRCSSNGVTLLLADILGLLRLRLCWGHKLLLLLILVTLWVTVLRRLALRLLSSLLLLILIIMALLLCDILTVQLSGWRSRAWCRLRGKDLVCV